MKHNKTVAFLFIILIGVSIGVPIYTNLTRKDDSTFRVCIDDALFPVYENLLKDFQLKNSDIDIEIIRIPAISEKDNYDREEKMLQIRSDIIRGYGPDIFINYISAYKQDITNNLFQDTVKAISSGAFASLEQFTQQKRIQESYLTLLLENTKFKGSNYVLPLQFMVQGVFVTETKVVSDLSAIKTPSDWANAIDQMYNTKVGKAYIASDCTHLSPPLLDYENKKLDYSEAWFVEWSKQLEEHAIQQQNNDVLVGPAGSIALAVAANTIKQPILVPMPNNKGGTIAIISAYAAISATCVDLDIAYNLLEAVAQTCKLVSGDTVMSYTGEFVADKNGIAHQCEHAGQMFQTKEQKQNASSLAQDVLKASEAISTSIFRDSPSFVITKFFSIGTTNNELDSQYANEVYGRLSRYISE